MGWLPQTSSLAVPTPGPASPHRPCGKHQPWDVCSWFFCLPLCLLRCCSLPATILEGFPGGTPTRAAGSGWEVRSRKQWHCICPYTEQCPVQEGPAGAIFQPCSPCDFSGTLHSLLLLALLWRRNSPPRPTGCAQAAPIPRSGCPGSCGWSGCPPPGCLQSQGPVAACRAATRACWCQGSPRKAPCCDVDPIRDAGIKAPQALLQARPLRAQSKALQERLACRGAAGVAQRSCGQVPQRVLLQYRPTQHIKAEPRPPEQMQHGCMGWEDDKHKEEDRGA